MGICLICQCCVFVCLFACVSMCVWVPDKVQVEMCATYVCTPNRPRCQAPQGKEVPGSPSTHAKGNSLFGLNPDNVANNEAGRSLNVCKQQSWDLIASVIRDTCQPSEP